MDAIQSLPAILLMALVAGASPGPATLAISTTAMSQGVGPGLKLAAGVVTGSFMWSAAAALGLSALMLTHGWIIEIIRYAGATYLIWLAFKLARASWRGTEPGTGLSPARHHYFRGLMLHVTNPKAIFFFGALYAVVLTPEQSPWALLVVFFAIGAQSTVVFLGYAFLFSRSGPVAFYRRSARWIQGISAICFAGFGLKLLTARIGS